MEQLTVIRSRKLAGPASLASVLETVDNVFKTSPGVQPFIWKWV